MLKLVDKLQVTAEEAEKFKLKLENSAYKWILKDEEGNDIDDTKEVEFSDDQAEKLKAILKRKSDAKEFKMAEAGPMLEIAEKLGMDL